MNDKREKCEFDRARPLFEKKRIPCEVHVRCIEPNGTNGSTPTHHTNSACRVQQTLKKCVNFTLRVMQGTRTSNLGNGTNERALRFELSDEYSKSLDSAPVESQLGSVQLYELEVGESDFSDLRQDQALLVDFSNFATSFISLLQMCELGQECDGSKDMTSLPINPLFGCKLSTSTGVIGNLLNTPESDRSSSSRYTCRLETSSNVGNASSSWNPSSGSSSCTKTARFSIVETNRFRELTHFSLNLRFASDAVVRNYLSMRLCEIMNCESMLLRELERERERVEKLECEFQVKRDQFGEFMEQSRVHSYSLHKDVEDKLQQEMNNHRLEMDTVQRNYEKVVHDLKENALGEKQNYEQRILNLERISDERIRVITDERNQSEQNLQKAQDLVSVLEQTKSKQDAAILTLESRLSQATMESSNQRDELDTYKTELKGLSMQVEYLKKDKDKLQQVVKRFHEDRIEMKRRMKAKVDMLRVHEEALVSKDMEVSSMHARMEEIESTIEGLRNELSNKEKQVEEMKIALIDQKKTLESNQQVITWLNKEINNFHKGGSGLSAVYNNTDELLKGIPNNMESSLVRFNSSRTMGGFSGPLFHAYPSSFMNTELEKTPTKNTGIRIEGSPKFTHSLQNPTYIPEPQPYVPRDKIIA